MLGYLCTPPPRARAARGEKMRLIPTSSNHLPPPPPTPSPQHPQRAAPRITPCHSSPLLPFALVHVRRSGLSRPRQTRIHASLPQPTTPLLPHSPSLLTSLSRPHFPPHTTPHNPPLTTRATNMHPPICVHAPPSPPLPPCLVAALPLLPSSQVQPVAPVTLTSATHESARTAISRCQRTPLIPIAPPPHVHPAAPL